MAADERSEVSALGLLECRNDLSQRKLADSDDGEAELAVTSLGRFSAP
jgi:hypothetical protein